MMSARSWRDEVFADSRPCERPLGRIWSRWCRWSCIPDVARYTLCCPSTAETWFPSGTFTCLFFPSGRVTNQVGTFACQTSIHFLYVGDGRDF